MTDFFAAIEQSAFSVFMRESLWAFPAALIFHAIGMAFLAGLGAAVCLRAIGVARSAPASLFARFLPVMWLGFWMSLASGLALLAAYPAKALTNPVFALKFLLLGGAALLVRQIIRRSSDAASPIVAWASLALWAGAIAAGRLLAYTHTVLMVS